MTASANRMASPCTPPRARRASSPSTMKWPWSCWIEKWITRKRSTDARAMARRRAGITRRALHDAAADAGEHGTPGSIGFRGAPKVVPAAFAPRPRVRPRFWPRVAVTPRWPPAFAPATAGAATWMAARRLAAPGGPLRVARAPAAARRLALQLDCADVAPATRPFAGGLDRGHAGWLFMALMSCGVCATLIGEGRIEPVYEDALWHVRPASSPPGVPGG